MTNEEAVKEIRKVARGIPSQHATAKIIFQLDTIADELKKIDEQQKAERKNGYSYWCWHYK